MLSRLTSAVVALIALVSAACAGTTTLPLREATVRPSRAVMSQLWVEPAVRRDLFWGVGGRRYAPVANALYRFEGKDSGGFSTSYDVTDPKGLEWSAKIGDEAQTEVVVSRILWGLGYHQPPVYYLPAWKLSGEDNSNGWRSEGEARFRPKLATLEREKDYWTWSDNPFSGTRELKGLLVVLLMLNSTDLKDDNNSIYSPRSRWDGATRWFVVRDLGAALGETGKLYPKRNWLEGFEQQGFITRISAGRVEFDYDGRHEELLTMITPADVRWAAQRMSRLTASQWQDAFRSAGYPRVEADRFITRIRQKIDDGLALRARPDNRRASR